MRAFAFAALAITVFPRAVGATTLSYARELREAEKDIAMVAVGIFSHRQGAPVRISEIEEVLSGGKGPLNPAVDLIFFSVGDIFSSFGKSTFENEKDSREGFPSSEPSGFAPAIMAKAGGGRDGGGGGGGGGLTASSGGQTASDQEQPFLSASTSTSTTTTSSLPATTTTATPTTTTTTTNPPPQDPDPPWTPPPPAPPSPPEPTDPDPPWPPPPPAPPGPSGPTDPNPPGPNPDPLGHSPEPTSWILLGSGLLGLWAARRRRR